MRGRGLGLHPAWIGRGGGKPGVGGGGSSQCRPRWYGGGDAAAVMVAAVAAAVIVVVSRVRARPKVGAQAGAHARAGDE